MPVPTAETHARVMVWAIAVSAQVGRLRQDRLNFLASHEAVVRARFYGPEDARPPRLMQADAHLLLIAANQLALALHAFDGDLRLTAGLTRRHVKALRDAYEHWSKRDLRAQKEIERLTDDPMANQWRREDGSGMLGHLVDDRVLEAWASAVYDELVNYDPPSQAFEL